PDLRSHWRGDDRRRHHAHRAAATAARGADDRAARARRCRPRLRRHRQRARAADVERGAGRRRLRPCHPGSSAEPAGPAPDGPGGRYVGLQPGARAGIRRAAEGQGADRRAGVRARGRDARGHHALPRPARRSLQEDRSAADPRRRADRRKGRTVMVTTVMVTLDEIRAARERVRPIVKTTPLVDVSDLAGRPLSLKCESLQPGGAFKIRGAYNMVAQLSDEERRRGVITYSSGNHGQGVAIAARALHAPAVIVMPTTAPAIKSEGAKSFGAEVVFEGTTSLDRRAKAEQIAVERGLTM